MKKRALFVGVDEYADARIAQLAHAQKDAGNLASLFRQDVAFPNAGGMSPPPERAEQWL